MDLDEIGRRYVGALAEEAHDLAVEAGAAQRLPLGRAGARRSEPLLEREVDRRSSSTAFGSRSTASGRRASVARW